MSFDAIFIDTETGGLDPKKNSLLQLGAVLVRGGQVVCEKEWNLRPYSSDERPVYKVTATALGINNINLVEHNKTAVDYFDACDELIALKRSFFGDIKVTFAGHNTKFDTLFLQEEFGSQISENFSHRTIDTCASAIMLRHAGLIPSYVDGLSALLEYFEIPVSGERHTALADARASFELYSKMLNLLQAHTA